MYLPIYLKMQFNPILQSVKEVIEKKIRNWKTTFVNCVVNWKQQMKKINVLENYARIDNLIISGLPSVDYSDAASANTTQDATESSQSTERAVLEFVNNTLNVPIKSNDISIAHRLKRTTATGQNPPNIIVRFANRKIRNDVYAARCQL